jgi:hypothetical protein
MNRFLILIVFLWPLTASAEGLSGPEINNKLVGQPIVWVDSNGWSTGSLFLLEDGKAEITVDDPRPSRDFGVWSLQGDQLCTVWSSMRNNMAKCYTVSETSPGHFVTSGGNEFEIRNIGV